MNATSIGSISSATSAFELTGNMPLSKNQLEDLEGVATHLGLTEEQKHDFIKAIESNRIAGEIHPTGKLGWAADAIRKGYNALPSPVKRVIKNNMNLEKLFDVIETYTGTVEDAIKSGLEAAGCSQSLAWWITKTFMALVL